MPITWNLELDISAARADLHYHPKYAFRDMLSAARAGPGAGEEFIAAESATGSASFM
jgi:hypothetical protein